MKVGGVLIIGLPTYHDDEQGAKRGKNTVYLLEVDGIDICHLGDLGHTLRAEMVEEIGNVDILMVPVGGGATLDFNKAAQVVRELEPKIVIPMHYKTPFVHKELDTPDKFLQNMGVKEIVSQPKLTMTRATLPATIQVVLLDYFGQ